MPHGPIKEAGATDRGERDCEVQPPADTQLGEWQEGWQGLGEVDLAGPG
jgi:hypothetical protein